MFTIIALVVCAAVFQAALRADRTRTLILGLIAVLLVFVIFRVNVTQLLDLNL